MKKRNPFTQIAVGFCLMLPTTIIVNGQKPVKCPSQNKTKTLYRVGITTRTIEGAPTLLMQVSMNPKRFNREDIIMLAQQLKNDFCNEQRIHVALFDDDREAKSSALIYGYMTHQGETGALRGFYDLDRTTGKEIITFATKRNNPLNEVGIDLSSKPSR